MKVSNPEKDLRALFDELVGGKPRDHGERQSIRGLLRKRFTQAGLERKLITDFHVNVPTFNREVSIPFGYQNGRFKLIQPAKFESNETSQAITSACRYAVEGRSLFHNRDERFGDLQLVVVGRFSSKKANNRLLVQKILDENQVKLYSSTELDLLIADIRENGKEITPLPPSPTSPGEGRGEGN